MGTADLFHVRPALGITRRCVPGFWVRRCHFGKLSEVSELLRNLGLGSGRISQEKTAKDSA